MDTIYYEVTCRGTSIVKEGDFQKGLLSEDLYRNK